MDNLNLKKFPLQYSEIPNPKGDDLILIARGSDQKSFKIKADHLGYLLGYNTIDAQPIVFSGSSLPSVNNQGLPIKKGDWTILTTGSYTNINGGLSILVPEQSVGISMFNGASWGLPRTINLPSGNDGDSLLKPYIIGDEWVQWQAVTLLDGSILRANKNTTSAPSKDSDDWDIVGGGLDKWEIDSTAPPDVIIDYSKSSLDLTNGYFIDIRDRNNNLITQSSYSYSSKKALDESSTHILVTMYIGTANGISFYDSMNNVIATLNSSDLGFSGDLFIDRVKVEKPYGATSIAISSRTDMDMRLTVLKQDLVTTNAKEFQSKISDLSSKWSILLQNANVDVWDDIVWVQGSYVSNNNGTLEVISDMAWQHTIVPLELAKFVDANLRGDNSRIALIFTKENIISGNSNFTILGSHSSTVSTFNTKFFYEINEEDGYLIINNRNYQYTLTDLYVKFGYTEGRISVDAQYLFDKIKANDIDIPSLDFIQIERPQFAKIYFYGDIPTDASESRTSTSGSFKMVVNGRTVLQANHELSIQGHGSATYPKKGFSFDILNSSLDSLKVKFGNMIAADGYHLKSYATDRTQSRDVANARIWRDMINELGYPYSRVHNKIFEKGKDKRENDIYIHDAQFYTDGFVVETYFNDQLYGLQTLRLKKTRENYALDRDNQNHIFLDSVTYDAFLSQPFDHTDWEVKSPRMSGYNGEGAAIPDANVLSKCQRLFNFTRQLNTQSSNHSDFIILPIWCVWIIFSEIVSNRDTNGNNYNIITWDGIHWVILPYDLDNTLGLNPWSGYVIDTTRNHMDINFDIWSNFKSAYINEIKEIYTNMRNSGFLTTSNLIKYYKDQIKNVPRESYSNDASRWASIWNGDDPSIEQIEIFIDGKLNYLDSTWLNS